MDNWDAQHPTYREELGRRLLSILPRFSSKSAAADVAGVTVEQLNKWTGSKKGVEIPKVPVVALLGLAEASGVSFEWLAKGDDASDVEKSQDFPLVPLYAAQASAGGGAFVDYAPIKDHIPFTPDFMRKRLGRTNTKGLLCVYARGDSMEPSIGNGDMIMVDTDQSDLSSDVFAFTYDDTFFIKRLQPQPGSLTVISDNPAYPPFTLEQEHMNELSIVGRVVHIGRTL